MSYHRGRLSPSRQAAKAKDTIDGAFMRTINGQRHAFGEGAVVGMRTRLQELVYNMKQ